MRNDFVSYFISSNERKFNLSTSTLTAPSSDCVGLGFYAGLGRLRDQLWARERSTDWYEKIVLQRIDDSQWIEDFQMGRPSFKMLCNYYDLDNYLAPKEKCVRQPLKAQKLEDYLKEIVEKEVKAQLKDIQKVQKLQEEKIRSMEVQIQRERLYRLYLEKNIIALKEKHDVQVSKDVAGAHEMARHFSGSDSTNHMNENHEGDDEAPNQQDSSSKIIRLIGGQENSAPSTVAFYAYMSKNLDNPSAGHVLVFDVVKTNIASGYNHHDGIFTAPSQGFYVFSWTIHSWYHSFVYSEVVVNSDSVGRIITNSEDIQDEHVGSSIVVVALNPGDVVYIRIRAASGRLASYASIFSSFSGWKLN
ncbi:uncharacterized protein LOC133184517 [Saccostrea echinata]|uniref:uncharacterized protein LOC133184517 n=1 Tax=Saccostrea echinata TaxID=191078 RepID=UPI002A801AB8|nr:uncharacterized protein LOC133184517 [Saccostrea echinata]